MFQKPISHVTTKILYQKWQDVNTHPRSSPALSSRGVCCESQFARSGGSSTMQIVEAPPVSREMVVIFRPSFMKFCQDGCRAAVFNHILYWISRKAKDQPKDLVQNGEITWYATTEEITEDL